jgi:hypothetical protein
VPHWGIYSALSGEFFSAETGENLTAIDTRYSLLRIYIEGDRVLLSFFEYIAEIIRYFFQGFDNPYENFRR